MAGGGMSHPARAPRSGIDGQTNAAQGRYDELVFPAMDNEAERMIHLARVPRSGIHAVGVSNSVRPGRVRNRTKPELDEKIKKPADSVRKKSPPARKAPARGRYVDEYARPTF